MVRRAVPARDELTKAVAAVERVQRLVTGKDKAVVEARNAEQKYPPTETEEDLESWTLGGWSPPHALFWAFDEFTKPVRSLSMNGAALVVSMRDVITRIDEFIVMRLLDPPPHTGRPKTSSVERYAYRYLAAVGLKPPAIADALGDLVIRLRTAEERIGLKSYPKTKAPSSLVSTIRRQLDGTDDE